MARKAKPSNRKGKDRKSAGRWFTLWDALEDRTQHLICVAFLLLVAVGFFAPLHFSGKMLVAGDTVNFDAMARSMIDYEKATGEQALWDTNAFGGMPGYMIYYPTVIPQLDDIPRFLRKYAWPTSHFIFLLLGMYLLVVFLTVDKLTGVFAACGYGLTTYLPVLLVAGHNTKFVALCFAPWMILAFVYLLRNPGLLGALLFAASVGVNLRAGHVQITYFFAFVLGVWWIVEAVSAARGGRMRVFAISTSWLVLGGVLAFMLVAQPYLSNFEYKAFTIRGAAAGGVAGGLGWQYAMGWSQGWLELLTLVISDAFGGAAHYWGPKPFTGGPHYVGGIVVMLAIFALWHSRQRAVWALGISSVMMILFSVGENFATLNRFMFDHFPLFDAFRVPETWLSAVAFGLVVLASFGLYEAVKKDGSEAEERRKSRGLYIVSGTGLALILVLILGRDAFFGFEKPGEREQLVEQLVSRNNVAPNDPRVAPAVDQYLSTAKKDRIDAFDGDAKRTLLFLLGASLLLVAYRTGRLPAWLLQTIVILLVTVDLGGVGRRYLNEDRMHTRGSEAGEVPTFAFDQFIRLEIEKAGGPGHFRTLSLLRDPSTNARPANFYETLSGYHGAKLRLYQDYLDHILFNPDGAMNRNGLSIMNARYVVGLGSLPGYGVAYTDNRFTVLRNPYAVPRGFFVGSTEYIASAEETWSRIRSVDFDPKTTAIVADSSLVMEAPIDSSSVAEAVLKKFSPREIEWEVNTDRPRLFVASEVYYPAGWTATIDSTTATIHRADYLLRAVLVPEGAHVLRMRFDPPSHRIGIWISGISAFFVYGGILLLLGLAWKRRRENHMEA